MMTFPKQLESRGLLKMLAGGATVAAAIHGLNVTFNYLLTVSLARWLSGTEFGNYAFALNLALLLAGVAGLGLPFAVLRFVPQYEGVGDLPRARGVVAQTWLLTILSGIAFMVVGCVLVLAFQPGSMTALILAMLLLALIAVANYQTELARSLHKLLLAYLPFRALWPAVVLGLVFLLYHLAVPLDSCIVLSLSLAVLLLIVVGQAKYLRGLHKDKFGHVQPQTETRYWLRVATPLWILVLGTGLLRTVDILILGLFVEPEQVGLYYGATRAAALVGFALFAVNAVVAPLISRLYHSGDTRQLRGVAAHAAQMVFWPTLCCAIGMLLFGDHILALFGDEFRAVKPVLMVLTVGHLFNASVGPVGHFMNLTGNQTTSAKVFFAAGILDVVLNLLLIPPLGLLGAAIATATSVVAWNVLLTIFVVKRLQVDPTIFGFLWQKLRRRESMVWPCRTS